MAEHKQVGPPARIGAYQISVVSDDSPVLARAVLAHGSERDLFPSRIMLSEDGLEVDASNVASDGRVLLPADALQALLQVGGWKVQKP